MRKIIKHIVSAPSGELIPLDLETRAHVGSSLRAFGRSEHEQAENVAELLKSIHT